MDLTPEERKKWNREKFEKRKKKQEEKQRMQKNEAPGNQLVKNADTAWEVSPQYMVQSESTPLIALPKVVVGEQVVESSAWEGREQSLTVAKTDRKSWIKDRHERRQRETKKVAEKAQNLKVDQGQIMVRQVFGSIRKSRAADTFCLCKEGGGMGEGGGGGGGCEA